MELADTLPGMAFRCRLDRHRTLEYVSSGCRDVTGHPADDLVDNESVSFADLIHEEDRDRVRETVREGTRAGRLLELESRIRTAEDEVRWVSERSRPLRGEDGDVRGLEGFLADVTRRRALETEVRQTGKMEAMGRLSGAIAHDLNNFLTGITGFASLLLDDLEPDARGYEEAREIYNAGRKAGHLTAQLLAFNRRDAIEVRPIDLVAELEDALGLLRRLVRADVAVETDLPDHPVHVEADPAQIQQVLINLLVNANDAMPNGGRVELEVSGTMARNATLGPGSYGVLAVEDTGTGMSEGVLAEIFEHGFTTKGERSGTGLGLTTVKRVVEEELGGSVRVLTELGRGTRFEVYLPRLEGEVAGKDDAAGPAAEVLDGEETILLVDDDREVLDFGRAALTRRGYRVLAASSLEQAEEAMADEPRIDLLIADTVLPRRVRDRVARRFASRHPEGKTFYISGYLPPDLPDTVISAMRKGNFLQKPFDATDLSRKVRQVLDR